MKKILLKLEKCSEGLDRAPLWWLGLLLMGAVFAPYVVMGEKSVFPIHDQLDETLLTYVLNARHLFDGSDVFPELLGGIGRSGMQPSAILFVPLYCFLSPFAAFVVQYAVVFAAGFFGMYFCVREMTESSILSLAAAGCFALLPAQPVYGLSVMGVPLLIYSFLCLCRRKRICLSLVLTIFFGLTTHLVLIGYVMLGFWLLAIIFLMVDSRAGARRKAKAHRQDSTQPCAAVRQRSIALPVLGFFVLLTVYIAVNYRLFIELLLGKSNYTSHREELVNGALPFWETAKGVFLESAQHAQSLHRYLIVPILVLLLAGAFLYRRLGREDRIRYAAALTGFLLLVGIAALYALCKTPAVTAFKNSRSGFLRYFQLERFYWLYPAGWYLEFALCACIPWHFTAGGLKAQKTVKLLCLAVVLLPTIQLIKVNSYFYMSVNQINNGSGVTGYVSWESYYAEELMCELEEAIGRDKTTYRVAHVGISPAPALMHGFYTADGYSNNYPLEYKHRFRAAMARELEKNESVAAYFDTWGSRCYLFNSVTGNLWMLGKEEHIAYERLDYDIDALNALGCEYLFSCGEIGNAQELGIRLLGYFETPDSYWGVWLYECAK